MPLVTSYKIAGSGSDKAGLEDILLSPGQINSDTGPVKTVFPGANGALRCACDWRAALDSRKPDSIGVGTHELFKRACDQEPTDQIRSDKSNPMATEILQPPHSMATFSTPCTSSLQKRFQTLDQSVCRTISQSTLSFSVGCGNVNMTRKNVKEVWLREPWPKEQAEWKMSQKKITEYIAGNKSPCCARPCAKGMVWRRK